MNKSTSGDRQIPTEATVTKPPVQALCCQCGNLGHFPSTLPSRGNPGGLHRPYESCPDEGPERCVMQRKCSACRVFTTHAILREDDGHRDYIEDTHRGRCERGELVNPASPSGYQWGYCTYCTAGVAELRADRARWDAAYGGA